MFKKLFIFLSLCIILFIIIGCAENFTSTLEGTSKVPTTPSNSTTTDSGGDNTMNKITAYTIYGKGRDIYNQFIQNPSYDVLNQQSDEIRVNFIAETPAGKIKLETISHIPGTIQEYDEGVLRIGERLPVYKSLIDFVGNVSEIKKYLDQNGVKADIESVSFISGGVSPHTIWVQTDKGNYFITINYQKEDVLNNPHKEVSYIYRFYNQIDYYEKFRMKDAKLIVKGKDITAGNYAKIQFDHVFIPLKAVVEQLGGKVEWNNDNPEVFITYNSKKYILNTSVGMKIYEVREPENIIIQPPLGGGYLFSEIINGDIIILESNIRIFLKNQMGATVNIDYDNLMINIG